jgi:hypothetical protein
MGVYRYHLLRENALTAILEASFWGRFSNEATAMVEVDFWMRQ